VYGNANGRTWFLHAMFGDEIEMQMDGGRPEEMGCYVVSRLLACQGLGACIATHDHVGEMPRFVDSDTL